MHFFPQIPSLDEFCKGQVVVYTSLYKCTHRVTDSFKKLLFLHSHKEIFPEADKIRLQYFSLYWFPFCSHETFFFLHQCLQNSSGFLFSSLWILKSVLSSSPPLMSVPRLTTYTSLLLWNHDILNFVFCPTQSFWEALSVYTSLPK